MIRVLAITITILLMLANGALCQLPIGTNLPGINYYEPALLFTDVMKTADLRADGIDTSNLSYTVFADMPKDSNGYPLDIPWTHTDGYSYRYIAYINSYYSGEYALLYDGEGTVSISISSTMVDGHLQFTLPGIKTNIWLTISSTSSANHINNIRIIPVEYVGDEVNMPTFRASYTNGILPFDTLRFMDLTRTNNSVNIEWGDRNGIGHITQGGSQGIAWDHVVELSNQLDKDPWVCVPHQASDDYITQLATFLRDNVESGRTIYLEYSNELWNWAGFTQSTYVNTDAPGHPNSYVSTDLAAIETAGGNFPEKDAYMMARTFRLFSAVFGAEMSTRVVRVATGQVAWADNSRRILEYLFNTDGVGADALAVGGYFYFNPADHDVWNAMDPATVTPEMVLQSAEDYFDSTAVVWTRDSASYAKQYGVDYMVYEGGQHMQPYNQQEWDYNHAVWDAQIAPGMYDLYMDNFDLHEESGVNCKLFMAFSYVSSRESQYGSWGHLENLDQLQLSPAEMLIAAPKYQALLDANGPYTEFVERISTGSIPWAN